MLTLCQLKVNKFEDSFCCCLYNEEQPKKFKVANCDAENSSSRSVLEKTGVRNTPLHAQGIVGSARCQPITIFSISGGQLEQVGVIVG